VPLPVGPVPDADEVLLLVGLAVDVGALLLTGGGEDPPQGAPVRRIFLASWA
jgi:hypothetical protein